MTVDLTIRPVVSQNGDITLLVKGANLPDEGREFPRAAPDFDEALVRHFQRAKLNPAQLQELQKAVTDWLLGQDLQPVLDAAMPGNNGRLRMLVSVPDNARQIVSRVPFELLWDATANTYLLLRNDVASLCYLLSKTRSAASSAPTAQSWPFKILLVRSSPPDLDAVPEAAGLAGRIRQAGAHYGDNMVQVDVISREAAVNKPATWTHFMEYLRQHGNEYNVLVYLGHGEVMTGTVSAEPIGHLIFESEDGAGHLPVSAPQLARLLARYPINMVVLAGCVTGADPASNDRGYGGEQGVAQALVNSADAKVEVAVAMRSELVTTAAETFLRAFFDSLFNITPDASGNRSAGNVDAAVQHARSELFLANPIPPQWAAPVVLRATRTEPFIEHLAQPIRFVISERMQMALELRARLRKGLEDYSLAQGGSNAQRAAALADIRQMIREEGLRQGALILPADVTIGPGQTGLVRFELAGAVTVRQMEGRISAPPGITVNGIVLPAAAADRFKLLLDNGDAGWFELRARDGAPAPLPEGTLLEATLSVSADQPPGVYPVTIEQPAIQPPAMFWPGDGVLIIPRP